MTPTPSIEDGDERFLRALTSINSKPYFNPLEYNGKLDLDELMSWNFEMEKYFGYENIPTDKKVKIVRTKWT